MEQTQLFAAGPRLPDGFGYAPEFLGHAEETQRAPRISAALT
jgi:hypothetical protein